MELDAHLLGVVVMRNRLGLAHFHPAHIQHKPPAVFIQTDIAAHFDAHSLFEILIERRRIVIGFDKTFPLHSIRFIRDTKDVQPFPVPQLAHVKRNEIALDDDIVRLFPNLGDVRRLAFDVRTPDENAVPFFSFRRNGRRDGLRQNIRKPGERRRHAKSRDFFFRLVRRKRHLVSSHLLRLRQRRKIGGDVCAGYHLHPYGRPRAMHFFCDVFAINKNFFRKSQLGAHGQKRLQRRTAVRRLDVHRPAFRVDFHERDGVRFGAALQSIFRHIRSSKFSLSIVFKTLLLLLGKIHLHRRFCLFRSGSLCLG